MNEPFRLLVHFFRCVGVALVLALILVVMANVVFREAFGIALVWANEVAMAMFVWTAFIGAGISFAENARIRFTYFTDRLPAGMNANMEILVTWVGFVVLAGFFTTGLYVTYIHRHETFTTMPASVVWEWAAVPVGTALALVGWIRNGVWTYGHMNARTASKLAGT
jgi:TRAP-type C4-dicarboxylate transport system permease small subunit